MFSSLYNGTLQRIVSFKSSFVYNLSVVVDPLNAFWQCYCLLSSNNRSIL